MHIWYYILVMNIEQQILTVKTCQFTAVCKTNSHSSKIAEIKIIAEL